MTRKSVIFVCSAAVTMLATVPVLAQQAPMDRAALIERQRRGRQEQYRSMKQSVATMPPAGVKKVEDLFRLKAKGRDLAVVSLVADDHTKNGSFRVEVPEFSGPTAITVSTVNFPRAFIGGAMKVAGPNPAGGGAEPYRTFSLMTYDMPDDDTLVTLNVQAQPAYLHVQRTVQSAETSRTVQLVQQRVAEAVRGPASSALTLTVSEYGFNFGRGDVPQRPPLNLTLQAADFPTLVRQYPKEVEEHLRPLLRALGQEAVFAPDDLMAWQVFADQWKPDGQAVERVASILPALDDPDYRKRERAARELENMGRPGAAALLRLDRTGFSAERNLLIDRALAPYTQLKPKEAERLRSDKAFLLDCLYSTDAAIRAAALDRLNKQLPEAVAFDVDAAAPDRAAAVASLRQKLLPDVAGSGRATPTSQPAKS